MQFNPKALIVTGVSLVVLWAAINWQSSVLGIVVGAALSVGLWAFFVEGWPGRDKVLNALGLRRSKV
jgi:hypothetical protein